MEQVFKPPITEMLGITHPIIQDLVGGIIADAKAIFGDRLGREMIV